MAPDQLPLARAVRLAQQLNYGADDLVFVHKFSILTQPPLDTVSRSVRGTMQCLWCLR